MLLLLIDGIILAAVILGIAAMIQHSLKKVRENKIQDAILRQKKAEELAKVIDELDVTKLKEDEKKVEDKLNGLH